MDTRLGRGWLGVAALAAAGALPGRAHAQQQQPWVMGPLHPNVTYEVQVVLDNRCRWGQSVDTTVTYADGGTNSKTHSVPASKLVFLPVNEGGTGSNIYGWFNHPDVRVRVQHGQTRWRNKLCLAKDVTFPTRGRWGGDDSKKGTEVLRSAVVVLEEREDVDHDEPKTTDPPDNQKHPRSALKKALPWIGGGAAVIGGAVVLGGSGGAPAATTPTTPGSTPPPVTSFCGNFTGNLAPTQVGCGFSTSFASVVELTCSADGTARLVIRRADNDPEGQHFEYTGRVSTSGALEFTGSGNLRGLATYNGRFVGTVSGDGRVLQGTNTVAFTEPGCAGQTLVQSVSGTR